MNRMFTGKKIKKIKKFITLTFSFIYVFLKFKILENANFQVILIMWGH